MLVNKLTMLAGALCVACTALAQDYPSKPIRMVSPFAAGGNTDTLGRYIAPRLHERLGQPVIMENRPGAGGMTGTNYVAKSAPDGYTLLFISGAYTAHSATVKNLPYDPLKDFEGVSMAVSYPFIIIVKADSPIRNVADLISAAKKNPGKMNYGSVGVGSVFHLAAELFNVMAGTDMTHIPYKGGAEPLTELIGGRLDVIFNSLTASVPHIKTGRVRAIAVASLERARELPDVPTVAQTLPGYEVTSFAGLLAPRGVPRAIIERLNREMKSVLELPEIRRQFTELGGDVKWSTPEGMMQHVTEEIAKWKRVIEARKIEIQ